ncbi:Uma2 family endonuclease [Hyalangium rubrum]|uniref:Uma2 family endonuclease n=1 Tax=Hyalangium rubrum TaxID=3103134 RepID=A0ABU5GYT7_9BACT|nr:Uma2 family endonuclease [Hyalangium sp. s54d21]MDY7226320.1 Uma2 family endonuclease [Hyalangium sp. s54d21]
MSEQPPRREATYEDLEKLPPEVIGELVDGELFASPRPAMKHSRVTIVLSGKLMDPFDHGTGGPGGWLLLYEPELHLRRNVLVPDLAGWRRERMPELPDTVGATLAPDWVCEVLSPSTMKLDRGRKMGVYAREGVKHLWLMDPVAQLLEVYRLEGGRWLLLGTHEGNATVRAEPFEVLDLELGAVWAR